MNCLVIDDEPLAREGLMGYIREIDFLNPLASCEHPLEAFPFLEKEKIDLIFLDIQMPKLNGLDFLKSLAEHPLVIITTAFPSFALEGFQLDVLDYLVKPITFSRFFKAVNKARKQYLLLQQTMGEVAGSGDYFFIKCDNKLEKIRLEELLFIEAMQNYVLIYTLQKKFTTWLSLKNLAGYLPADRFLQVHKSFIVSLDKIDSFEGNQVHVGNLKIPVSRSKRAEIMKRVVEGKLLKKL